VEWIYPILKNLRLPADISGTCSSTLALTLPSRLLGEEGF